MHLQWIIFLYFITVQENFAKVVEIQCPTYCKCDIFQKLKRAKCSTRNLAFIELNLPNNQTQILDLSYNKITQIRSYTFREQNLLTLKLLNVSHNKISQIDLNAFEGLNDLKTLDLSYNSLQYILQMWFLHLNSLEELYLRGNNFKRIQDEPFFDSPTLKILDLNKCQIDHIGNSAMSKIPALEILDLSENYLLHLSVEVIKPLTHLKILNVQNNTLACDGILQNLSNFCIQQGIRFKDPCKKNVTASDKFERIINMAEPEDEKNSWIYDDEENIKNVTTTIENCNFTQTNKSLLLEILELSPALSIIIPFIYGIAVGILIIYSSQIFSKKKEDNNEFTYVSFEENDPHLRRTRTRRNRFSRAVSNEDQESLPFREWKLSESTPVLFRKNQPY